MKASEKAAHEYASKKREAYVAKFKRPVSDRAADGVYVHFYGRFMRKARAAAGAPQ